jgi:hypothetical protein
MYLRTKQPISIIAAFAITLSPVSVGAQALQNTGGGLQPQSSQTQNSVNTQDGVQSLQTNNGQILSQPAPQSLGVVSDPQQTKADTVVAPSETLKTEVTSEKPRDYTPHVVIALLVVTALGYYISRRASTPLRATKEPDVIIEPIKKEIVPEPIKTPKKKKSTTRKRRKKSQQR